MRGPSFDGTSMERYCAHTTVFYIFANNVTVGAFVCTVTTGIIASNAKAFAIKTRDDGWVLIGDSFLDLLQKITNIMMMSYFIFSQQVK